MSWIVLAVLLAASIFYYLGMVSAALRHGMCGSPAVTAELPAVSILKPLANVEPGLASAARSHFAQNYPETELLACGVPGSQALAIWKETAAAFPGVAASTVVPPGDPAPNRKVGKLESLAAAASHDVLLITDADVSLARNHLRQGVAKLSEDGVGLVTALYRAAPAGSVASHVEALWVSAELQGRFLLSTLVGGLRFAFGASILVRSEDVERIGGFEAIRDYLADDYQLGNRIHRLGRRIVLTRDVVTTQLGARSATEVWRHQLRWARTIRVSQPWGYFGLVVAQGSLWSMLAIALPGAPEGLLPIALLCLSCRLTAAYAVGWDVLRSPVVLRYILLLPVVDLLASAVWVAGMFGSQVTWQGRRIRVQRDGRIGS